MRLSVLPIYSGRQEMRRIRDGYRPPSAGNNCAGLRSRALIKSFLQWTEAAVSPGSERFHLDLDAHLARILANG
jgi:hypothetical protein